MLAERLRALDEARQSANAPTPDVRVIVSTTRDVDEELAAGRMMPELRRALPRTLDLAPLRAQAGRPAGARPAHPPAPGRTGRPDGADHLRTNR